MLQTNKLIVWALWLAPQNPVVNFDLPIRLDSWFPRQRVRQKREDIRRLIMRMHQSQTEKQWRHADQSQRPPRQQPTRAIIIIIYIFATLLTCLECAVKEKQVVTLTNLKPSFFFVVVDLFCYDVNTFYPCKINFIYFHPEQFSSSHFETQTDVTRDFHFCPIISELWLLQNKFSKRWYVDFVFVVCTV